MIVNLVWVKVKSKRGSKQICKEPSFCWEIGEVKIKWKANRACLVCNELWFNPTRPPPHIYMTHGHGYCFHYLWRLHPANIEHDINKNVIGYFSNCKSVIARNRTIQEVILKMFEAAVYFDPVQRFITWNFSRYSDSVSDTGILKIITSSSSV